ncbi:hypothetical protein HPB47_019027 [Ixodes persulcatus]|uniref:Uncharacterized protein n=1 Tax=Ixodes persulcatus TaxID=34615 RepID=A0AC60QJ73_IXOPE|nr:hypothetical protein HPB47_019027 [Ixodes persulcatus]
MFLRKCRNCDQDRTHIPVWPLDHVGLRARIRSNLVDDTAMAFLPSTLKASIEPAVHNNSTGRNNAGSSAAASQDPPKAVVVIMKIGKVRKAMHNGCAFTYTSQSRNVFRWKCEVDNCSATLKTDCVSGTHYAMSSTRHDEQEHMQEFSRLSGGGPSTPRTPHDGPKRKVDSCADKPPETMNGDTQVPAKKSKGRHFLVGGVFKKPLQDTPPRKPEDAAGDNSK